MDFDVPQMPSGVHAHDNKDTLRNYFEATKPDFPTDSIELECPACGRKSIYQQKQLTYRS